MATYANASNQVAALKELYDNPSDYMKDLVYKKNPLLALIPKDESPSGFAGKYIPVPLIYATPQGRSGTFATAQTNQTAPQLASFFVYRVSNYQLCTIQNELIEATKDDVGAFVDQQKLNMDTSFRNISNDLAHDLFSDGSGSRGTYGLSPGTGTISTGVITLDDPQTVVNFEVGMVLVSYSVSGTTPTIATGGAFGYIIAVNRSTGVITVSATAGGSAGTPTNWSTSFPYLAVSGDINFVSSGLAVSSTGALKIAGLGAWLPTTAPGSTDSFWGVNRSTDVTRLGGVRFNGSSESIEEALIDGSTLVAREGGQPDMAFVPFSSYAALEKSLGSKVQYVDVKHDEADIAFAGIRIHAPYGPITVIPDRSCPSLTAYLLQMDTWKLRSLGKAPHILKYGMEGLEGLRVAASDALEIRIGYYANLVCCAPGWNCVVQLSQ